MDAEAYRWIQMTTDAPSDMIRMQNSNQLIDEGKTVEEIGKQLGMKPEEIFRLSGFTKDEFLNMMTKGHDTYSKAQVIRSV